MPLSPEQLKFFTKIEPIAETGNEFARVTYTADKERHALACIQSGTCFDDDTPIAVARILDSYKGSAVRLRLFYGSDAKPNWLEEYGVVGTIGRSMGPIKAPLILPRVDSIGGGAILTACIRAILVAGQWLYRHPGFAVPTIALRNDGDGDYPWRAYIDGATDHHAAFKTEVSAKRWAAFMRGERMAK